MDAENHISTLIPKILVVCDQRETAPVWGYILRQNGLTVALETSRARAIKQWNVDRPVLAVIDVDISQPIRIELFKNLRETSMSPVILLLPTYHESQILEAYEAGVDEVVIKPISPAIFLAKIMAWVRRGKVIPANPNKMIKTEKYSLNTSNHNLIGPGDIELDLTNLEFQLLLLTMSSPSKIFSTEEIVNQLWGIYGSGDQSLLKNVVYRLRKKIKNKFEDDEVLQTELGGYSFQG